MVATAARVADDPRASDDEETDDEFAEAAKGHAGSLALIEKVLRGIAATSKVLRDVEPIEQLTQQRRYQYQGIILG